MTLTPLWDSLKLADNAFDGVVLPEIIIDPPFHGEIGDCWDVELERLEDVN